MCNDAIAIFTLLEKEVPVCSDSVYVTVLLSAGVHNIWRMLICYRVWTKWKAWANQEHLFELDIATPLATYPLLF